MWVKLLILNHKRSIYTIYYKVGNTTEVMSTKHINMHLHKDEMKKYPIGTKIAEKFNSLWYHDEIESINADNQFFKVKYEDSDWEEMSLDEVKNIWIQVTKEIDKQNK